MDIAVVTGASTSLGEAIASKLITIGFKVYGLGGDYSRCQLNNSNFIPLACDLSDLNQVEQLSNEILEKEGRINVLVQNAKFYGRNTFLVSEKEEWERIIRTNLMCPVLLTRIFGEGLCKGQGYIFHLGATRQEAGRGGPVGLAAAGGLKWFGDGIFDELRSFGVKVVQISPEPNRNKQEAPSKAAAARKEAVIDPEAVAGAISDTINSHHGNVPSEIVLRPLRIQELELEKIKRIPYPEPKPIPYTVPREVIEAEEEQEELERQEAQKERNRRRQKRRRERDEVQVIDESPEEGDVAEKPEVAEGDSDASSEDRSKKGKNRRRRSRRRGKRRDEEGDGNDAFENREPSGKFETPSPREVREAPVEREEVPSKSAIEKTVPEQTPVSEPTSKRKRSRRKPKPPLEPVGFVSIKQDPASSAIKSAPIKKIDKEPAAEVSSKEKTVSPEKDKESQVIKKAAKKASAPAKKAAAKKSTLARKTAKKATPAKKAVKKTVSKKVATKKIATKKAAKKAVKKATAKKATRKIAKKKVDKGTESAGSGD